MTEKEKKLLEKNNISLEKIKQEDKIVILEEAILELAELIGDSND